MICAWCQSVVSLSTNRCLGCEQPAVMRVSAHDLAEIRRRYFPNREESLHGVPVVVVDHLAAAFMAGAARSVFG